MVRTRVLFVVTFATVGFLTGALAASATSQQLAGDRSGPALAEPDSAVASEFTLSGVASPAVAQEEPDADDTVTRVQVYENGSARWTIEIRTRLQTDEDVENFEAFQETFAANTSAFLDPFADRMTGVVASAENATGREMTATDFTAETSIQEVPRRWGVVSFSFRWSAFAASDGDALVVGDVFEGGFFLAENDSMVVSGPDGYEIADARPQPTGTDAATLTWEGRKDFADGHPRVRFELSDSTSTPGQSGRSSSLSLGIAVGALVAVGAGAWLYRRRGGDGLTVTVTGTGGSGDAPVRTDAERVEELLADEGGRMRQADVAEELGWSASKTSRVLADMVEDGRIEKLRVGRRNVVELRDEE